MSQNNTHYVYIVECADKTLYCGSTNDLEKRIHAHNNLKTGAKYTKPRRPVTLVYTETFNTLGEALKREMALKKLSREQKLALLPPKSWTYAAHTDTSRGNH